MPATQSSGCAERKSTHFELIVFWPVIGWNLAASADQSIAGQNRLSSKHVDIYSAQALGHGLQYPYFCAHDWEGAIRINLFPVQSCITISLVSNELLTNFKCLKSSTG